MLFSRQVYYFESHDNSPSFDQSHGNSSLFDQVKILLVNHNSLIKLNNAISQKWCFLDVTLFDLISEYSHGNIRTSAVFICGGGMDMDDLYVKMRKQIRRRSFITYLKMKIRMMKLWKWGGSAEWISDTSLLSVARESKAGIIQFNLDSDAQKLLLKEGMKRS